MKEKKFRCVVCEKNFPLKKIRVVQVCVPNKEAVKLERIIEPSDLLDNGFATEKEFWVCADCVTLMSFPERWLWEGKRKTKRKSSTKNIGYYNY